MREGYHVSRPVPEWHDRRRWPRCEAPMRYLGEKCARRLGHKWEHRSEYALANARLAKAQIVDKRVAATA